MKRRNPFERHSYSYSEFRKEFRAHRFERTYEKFGTPSLFALIAWVLVTIIVCVASFYFFEIWSFLSEQYTATSFTVSNWWNNPSPQPMELRSAIVSKTTPAADIAIYYREQSYLPTLITGIATFGFALLFFVAEFMRDKGSHPSSKVVIQKTLIFPLVVSCISSFLVFAFATEHPQSLGIGLSTYLGFMALIGVWQLFNWIWVRNQPAEGGDIPAAKAIYRLFLYELNLSNQRFSFRKKIAEWQLQKMKEECAQTLNEFAEGILNHPSQYDEDYMTNFGRTLVRIRGILEDNTFIKNKSTEISKLVLPYLETIIFHDREIPKLILKGKKWIRRAAYQSIINAELALEVGDKNSMSYSLQLPIALYGLLNPDKKLRDEFLETICTWLNEFSTYYLERKLFHLPRHITDHLEITDLTEVLFYVFSSNIYRTFESGLEEGSDKNFRYVLSTYSELVDDYLRGGFGASRDIEHEAEGAEFWLKNPENAPKKPEQYMLDLEINNARLALLQYKRGLLACMGAIIFHDIHGKYREQEDEANKYLSHIFSQLVISVESLLSLYLDLPSDLDDKLDLDIYTRPRSSSHKPQAYSVPNIILDLLPPTLLYVLLSKPDIEIPEKLEEFKVKGAHRYRLEKIIELLEKSKSDGAGWSSKLDDSKMQKIDPLLALLKSLHELAKEKEKEEERQTPLPPNAEKTFKSSVMEGYKKSSAVIDILKKLGAKVQIEVDRKYQGKKNRFGFSTSNSKSTMLSDGQLQTVGKMYGEKFAEEEGRLVLNDIVKNSQKYELSLAKTFESIAQTGESECVLCTSHWYWFDAMLQSESIINRFIPVDSKNDQKHIERFGSVLRGYLQLNNKKIPVIALHQSVLDGKLLLLQQNKIGKINYLSAEPYGEPQQDQTTVPLYIRFVAFSDNEEELNKALKSRKTLPDIKGKEAKRKTLQEIVFTEILFRFEFELEQNGVTTYKLNLKSRLGPRRKRKKK